MYLSSLGIHAWKIHSRDKLERGGVVGIVGTTMNPDTVDTVLMDALLIPC